MPERLTLSYYPWITQTISGPKLADAVEVFVDLLRAELQSAIGNDLELKLLPAMEIPDQLDELEAAPSGNVTGKIGLLNPIGYAISHHRKPDVEVVAIIRRKIGEEIGPTYRAQLYTHRKTFMNDIQQLKGRSLAFGSPQSTSNFLVPAMMLFKAKIHPLNGLSRVEFAGGHPEAASAVYEGRVDAGAGHDGVIVDLAKRPGYADAEEVLQRIKFSDPIPSDPVAVHVLDPGLRDQIGQALRKVASPDPGQEESAGNNAVFGFWGTKKGFDLTVAPDPYAMLFELMTMMGLRDTDILRKP
jgi:phosphonate transport system substrate-binding protein